MTDRIFGLDILRSVAILFVMIGHANILLSPPAELPYLDGVELFFVLSGYLVGTILLKHFNKKSNVNLRGVFSFLKRRWFRTLPNYFLFLIINLVLIGVSWIPGEINDLTWTYFVFIQNLFIPIDFMFWESWSLSVEEWFYFSCPILLLAFQTLFKNIRYSALLTIVIFITIPLIYRLYHALPECTPTFWDLYFRKLVISRLDSIGFGLLIAYLYFFHSNFIQKHKWIFITIGVLIYCFGLRVTETSFYGQSLYFSQMSLGIAFMIPLFNSWKSGPDSISAAVETLSKISYSMYLSHLPILHLTSKFANQNTSIKYILYWLLTIVFSYLIYRFFERPLTNLREYF